MWIEIRVDSYRGGKTKNLIPDKVGPAKRFTEWDRIFPEPFCFQAKKKSAMIAGKNFGSK